MSDNQAPVGCTFCPVQGEPLVEVSSGMFACTDCLSDLNEHEEC